MEPCSSITTPVVTASNIERKRPANFDSRTVEESDGGRVLKPSCKYGKNCYRKNPNHLEEFTHPGEDHPLKRRKVEKERTTNKDGDDIPKKHDVPFYLTTVQGIDERFNHPTIALSLSGILSMDKEQLVESCQFNYMFDVPWLINKYPYSTRDKPLLLVHGVEGSDKLSLQGDAMKYKNIDLVQAKLPIPYGTHHTKMMFLLYEHGCRVVIHTANLIQQDWYQKTQGIWLSPLFKEKSSEELDDENDQFKNDLFEYISAYNNTKLSRWIEKLRCFDMTDARVRIIASVPGRHTGRSLYKWGHLRLRKLLSEIGPDPSKVTPQWPVNGQFSSIGSLGTEPNKWLTSEWLDSLSQTKRTGKSQKAKLKLIFPTMENVRNSLEGYSAGGSLPFSVENASKQRYMREYLCEWKSDGCGRSLASPHIKTYARVSPDQRQAAWFVVTSANLSKAAWENDKCTAKWKNTSSAVFVR